MLVVRIFYWYSIFFSRSYDPFELKKIVYTLQIPQNSGSIFFVGVIPDLYLKVIPKLNVLLKQFVITTPLKSLRRVSCNFVVKKGHTPVLCTSADSQEILI